MPLADRSFERLEKHTCGVPEEQLPIPDVAGEHRVRGVPRLLPNFEGRDTRASRTRREAGAQAMARIPHWVELSGGHPIANNQGHRLAGESTRRNPPVSIDWPEYRTVLDPRGVEPVLKRPEGAVDGSAERDADLAPHAVLVCL